MKHVRKKLDRLEIELQKFTKHCCKTLAITLYFLCVLSSYAKRRIVVYCHIVVVLVATQIKNSVAIEGLLTAKMAEARGSMGLAATCMTEMFVHQKAMMFVHQKEPCVQFWRPQDILPEHYCNGMENFGDCCP